MLRRVCGGMPLRILCGIEEDVFVFVGLCEEVEDPVTSS